MTHRAENLGKPPLTLLGVAWFALAVVTAVAMWLLPATPDLDGSRGTEQRHGLGVVGHGEGVEGAQSGEPVTEITEPG